MFAKLIPNFSTVQHFTFIHVFIYFLFSLGMLTITTRLFKVMRLHILTFYLFIFYWGGGSISKNARLVFKIRIFFTIFSFYFKKKNRKQEIIGDNHLSRIFIYT